MKNTCEKSKIINKSNDIGAAINNSIMPGTESDTFREPYESPKMMLLHVKGALEILNDGKNNNTI